MASAETGAIPAPAATDGEEGAGARRWLGLVALTIGVAMIIVDATIVNVAIPSIIRDLGIGRTRSTRSCSPRC
jgi:hypothetical protein